jgi:NAD(P)-dependent dehydrogenase (short-subunit alcohol dehydrogenase family)
MRLLEGKVAVITGASKGIGAGTAITFASQGAKVVVNYQQSREKAMHVVSQIEANGGNAIAIQADVSMRCNVERLMQSAIDNYGTIDILMNNAGLAIDVPWDQMTDSDWDRVIDVNLTGTFLCSQVVAHIMTEHKCGKIINVSAATAIRGRKNGLNYCASKAGVIALTKCLAYELAPYVHVNCLLPGFTETEDVIERFGLNNPLTKVELLRNIPLGRMASTDDIARAALYLASPLSDYLTGQLLCMNGGSFMH